MKKERTILEAILLLSTILFSTSFHLGHETGLRNPQHHAPPFTGRGTDWVDSVYESLSEKERIAQLFMVRAYSNRGPGHTESIRNLIEDHNIGGICFFQGGPVRQAKLTNDFQSLAKTPLLIAMDAEWGLGMRLDSTISYPRQMMLGACNDDSLLYRMGLDIAAQLRSIGVHMNFAPVMDVNINPRNPVINSRSFGEEVATVSRKGVVYAMGLQAGGILAVAKHFPGHGDTDQDSHHTLPLIRHERKRLETVELEPFRTAIESGIAGIMMAHLEVPALDDGAGIPSSLSHPVATGLLQDEMGFGGLVVTDALEMAGAGSGRRPGETETLAFKAGNDILLLPTDPERAIRLIRREIRRGHISEEQLERSCKKILSAKYWAGLADSIQLDTRNLHARLNHNAFKATRSRLVQASLTLLVNKNLYLPLRSIHDLDVATLVIGDTLRNGFQHTVDLYLPSTHYNIPSDAPASLFMAMLDSLSGHDLVLSLICNTDMRVSRKYGITENTLLFLERLTQRQPSILGWCANPYSLAAFDAGEYLQAMIMAYEDKEWVQGLVAQLIFGGIPARGRLPVSVEGQFKAGEGLLTEPWFRLRYGLPEEAGVDSDLLYKVDSIALDAIRVKATPGCQILAARGGQVFYHKSFGHHTYARKDTVRWSDVYDLASITKIAATLPVLMRLSQDQRFRVDTTLGSYLPELDTCDKGELLISDILTHQAGLTPWIPFYYSTLEPMDADQPMISRTFSRHYPFRLAGHIYLNRNLSYKRGAYSRVRSEAFPMQVAEGLYAHTGLRDTIFERIIHSPLSEKGEYLYSDLGYYFFHQIIENEIDQPLETYVRHWLFEPLGARYTGYRPLEWMEPERIIPTENDLFFRRQLLRGYVHDPGAAMLGGVAGHAGVFSNANDLAKLMQMYLNGGEYGGIRYLSDSVINQFNTCIHCEEGNRRGLGFDKPEMDYEKEGPTCQCVSPASFGHSGFTGTLAWADPETDLLYIFLSNKIHPDQDNPKLVKMNVRTLIQEVFHDAFMNGAR